jgi:hypothetical protein
MRNGLGTRKTSKETRHFRLKIQLFQVCHMKADVDYEDFSNVFVNLG